MFYPKEINMRRTKSYVEFFIETLSKRSRPYECKIGNQDKKAS